MGTLKKKEIRFNNPRGDMENEQCFYSIKISIQSKKNYVQNGRKLYIILFTFEDWKLFAMF